MADDIRRKSYIGSEDIGSKDMSSIGVSSKGVSSKGILNKDLSSKDRLPGYFYLLVAVCIVLIIGIVLSVFFFGDETCQDVRCFSDKADDCSKVMMKGVIGNGTTVVYQAKDCVLTKYIEEFSEDEPDEVVRFFKDKKMTCAYQQGEFDDGLVRGLSIGLDSCEGELKDAIVQLRLAQLSIES